MNNEQALKVFNEAIKNNDMTVRTIEAAAHPYEGESVTEFIEYEINILRAAIGKMGFTIEVQPNDKEAIEAHIKSCEADIKQWEARLARVKGVEQTREYLAIFYLIEWRLPAENSVDGLAYWDPLIVSGEGETKTKDFKKALALYRNAKLNRPKDAIRLVRVTCEVLDE